MTELEDRLRAALRAGAATVSSAEPRIPDSGGPGRSPRPWLVPLAAAAVSVAVAVSASVGAHAVRAQRRPAAQPTVVASGSSPLTKHYSPVPAPVADQILDIDLTGSSGGWALLARSCSGGRCAALARTTDAGQHWQPVPVPAVGTASQTGGDCDAPCAVSRVRFLTSQVGYLFGPGLLTTSDAGASWSRRTGPPVDDLAVTGTSVLRIVHSHTGCPGPCDVRIQRSSGGSGTWATVAEPSVDGLLPGVLVTDPAGPSYALFADNLAAGVAHQTVLLRSLDAGLTWQSLPDGCADAHGGEAVAAAARNLTLVLLCMPHGGSGPGAVAVSTDAGNSFAPPRRAPIAFPGLVAVAATGRLFVASGTVPYLLATSDDDGRSWKVAVKDAEPFAENLPQPGRLAVSGRDAVWVGYPYHAWWSDDAGQHWRRVLLPR